MYRIFGDCGGFLYKVTARVYGPETLQLSHSNAAVMLMRSNVISVYLSLIILEMSTGFQSRL
jgi:hypothetical protein